MNRIKKVDELYKSTYISAAKKLSGQHNDRARELTNWAHEKGSPENFDRDHPHRFYFSRYISLRNEPNMDGYFSIIDIKKEEPTTNWRASIEEYMIYFKSDYGVLIRINTLVDVERPEWILLHLNTSYYNNDTKELKWTNSNNRFLFQNRKDAIEFKKYLHESISDDDGPFKHDEVNVSRININNMYTSDKKWYKK